MQLNEIGKTKKTVLNRFKNLTPGSKSDAFLNNITEIIERINPGVDYIPDNLKKIMQIKNLLSEFIEKKSNFPDLFGRATQIKDNIDKMIKVFKEKEVISIAISELDLSKNIQNALKGDININSRQTVDGGPVVKVTQVSPNRIVFANNQLTTLDRANTSDLISVSPLVSDIAVSVNAAVDRGAGGLQSFNAG